MPAQYEAMRDKFSAQGLSYDAAQAKAAAIYNATHPGAPVTGHHEMVKRAVRKKMAK